MQTRENTSTEPGTKKSYVQPALTEHGTAADLTRGQGGDLPDAEGGGSIFPTLDA